jgi:hypothetical protein
LAESDQACTWFCAWQASSGRISVVFVKTVIVLTGGLGRPAGVSLPSEVWVVAADSGAEFALELGLGVDLIVGDFDSVSTETLAAVARAGARVERVGCANSVPRRKRTLLPGTRDLSATGLIRLLETPGGERPLMGRRFDRLRWRV